MTDDTDKIVEKLYETYRQELVRWCRSMTGDLQTAEELVQETFLRALIHGALLSELGESQQRAWLYRTMKNLHVDRVRRGRRETTVERISEGMEAAKESEEIHQMELEELLEYKADRKADQSSAENAILNEYKKKEIESRFAPSYEHIVKLYRRIISIEDEIIIE